jgi:hypothetical protein
MAWEKNGKTVYPHQIVVISVKTGTEQGKEVQIHYEDKLN